MVAKNMVPEPTGEKKASPAREHMSPFDKFRQDMVNLVDGFFHGWGSISSDVAMPGFAPKIDVSETEREIKISVELPGMDETDIDVSLTRDILTITGEKKEEKEDRKEGYYYMERSYGSFSRTIPLPVEVDTDKVEAVFTKGVLTVRLPKTAKAIKEAKKVTVRSG